MTARRAARGPNPKKAEATRQAPAQAGAGVGGSPRRWAAAAVAPGPRGRGSNPCHRPSRLGASTVVVVETPHSGQPGEAGRTQARHSRAGATLGAWGPVARGPGGTGTGQ